MPRQNRMELEGLLLPGKIRKRGCSSSPSSSSSVIHNCRFKRAILVRKRGGSTTPVPSWRLLAGGGGATSRRTTPSSPFRAVDSPKSVAGKGKQQPSLQQPVSARKLAATLWEMNEVPSPKVKDGEAVSSEERRRRREARARERAAARTAHSGSLPPHLSDPSHSPVSERMDRSGTGSRHRKASSISQKLRLADQSVGAYDSISNASLMEIETRSRAQTPTGSTVGAKNHLKDVSNALMTSKELLKIINRVCANEDRPSSSMSLISALHAELERARLQVNRFIQEQRSEPNEINYLMKCFAEEKAAWKNKEQKMVEAAIESVVRELEVEKKLRKRLESLNKKLGKELAETRASLTKAVKELENEKRARVVIEQVCDELARDIGEENVEVEELKKESAKLCEEVEKGREMMQFGDALRDERVQMKLSEAKYQLEKNAAVSKLRGQLEAFLGTQRTKEKGRGSFEHVDNEELGAYLSKARFSSHQNELNEEDGGEVDDGVECEEDSAESDVHPIELSMDNNSKSYKWNHPCKPPRDFRKTAIDEEEIRGRHSTSSKGPRRSTSFQRSTSDVVNLGAQSERPCFPDDVVDWMRYSELERRARGNEHGDEMHQNQSIKDLKEHLLSGYRMDPSKGYASPKRQSGQMKSSRDPNNASQERHPMVSGNLLKSRLAEAKSEALGSRKSKW